MAQIYNYPNTNGRVTRTNLTEKCGSCNSAPILQKAFFGETTNVQQKVISLISNTSSSIVKNIGKITKVVSNLTSSLIQRINKQMSKANTVSLSVRRAIAKRVSKISNITFALTKSKIFLKLLSFVQNSQSSLRKSVLSIKAKISNISFVKRILVQNFLLKSNSLVPSKRISVDKKTTKQATVSTARTSRTYITQENINSIYSSMKKRTEKITLKVIQLSSSTQKRIYNIVSKIVNVVSVKNTLSSVTKKAYNNIANALIKIPIIISQSYYKTLSLIVNIGNFTNTRWLILSKSLVLTSSVYREMRKDIFKNIKVQSNVAVKKIILFVKSFFIVIVAELSKQKTFIKTLAFVSNIFSKFFSPVRFLVATSYVKLVQTATEFKKKRLYKNVTLITTKLTPLTRQVKTWVSRRFVKSTLK